MRPNQPSRGAVTFLFGSGVHSRASPLRIDPREAAEIENVDLDLEQTTMCGRKPFQLMGTAPNAQPVNGMAQLRKVDNTVSTLIQAGDKVYEWDGSATFTEKGTVNTAARLRGYDWHNWELSPEVVLISDVAQQEPVKRWDGTTFENMPHNLQGDFYARYINVEDDRAVFANVRTATVTEHIIALSKVEDYTNISVSTKPGSAVGEDDPVYLVTPNLRPINGLVSAFETLAVSTAGRQMYRLDGSNAKDFTFNKLYPDSGAAGREAVAYIGNDVAFGRKSLIETLFTAFQLGDVKTDDLTRSIADLTRSVGEWTIQYDRRRGKVYCLDKANSRIFLLYKPIIDERIRGIVQGREPPTLSPWSIWTTQHPLAFQTNVLMPMINPATGLEEIFMGGANGEVFMFEGEGQQDAGQYPVRVRRVSKTYQVDPPGGMITDISGHVLYKKQADTINVDLIWRFGGEMQKDHRNTVALSGSNGSAYFGGDIYWGGDWYWGTQFEGRSALQKYAAAGFGNTVQLEIIFEGPSCAIEEVFADFTASHAQT